jgi:hypothetical protein
VARAKIGEIMKSRNQAPDKKYDAYVEHPRHGQRPRRTGLDPSPYGWKVQLDPNARIPGTALKANPDKQNHPTVPVSHYYDIEKVCRDCERHFIFFAEEQKYWYETLQFPLDSDCVRCSDCRKTDQFLSRNRSSYERLANSKHRDWKDNLKMAKSALTLVENGVFGSKVVQKIRRLLKSVPDSEKINIGYESLLKRLRLVERKS